MGNRASRDLDDLVFADGGVFINRGVTVADNIRDGNAFLFLEINTLKWISFGGILQK